MAERAVVDWGGMSASQNQAQDENRRKKEHEVNKDQRAKERKARKKRSKSYTDRMKQQLDQAQVKVMVPGVIVPAILEPPHSEAIYNLIPSPVEYPTAQWTGGAEFAKPVNNVPWTVNPGLVGLPFLQDVIGTLIMMIGTRVVAQMATKLGKTDISGLQYNVSDSRVRMRLHTGRGAGAGRYVRPRGEGGQSPDDDADPYDQPSEWYEFWKWSF